MVKAQYIQKLLVITVGPFQSRDGRAKRAAKKVAGRKAMVMTATVFIELLSFLEASACSFEIKAKTYPEASESFFASGEVKGNRDDETGRSYRIEL